MIHPVSARFFFLEWLDRMVIYAVLGAMVVALYFWLRGYKEQRKCCKDCYHHCCNVIGNITVLLAMLYGLWRFFCSWKGYYY